MNEELNKRKEKKGSRAELTRWNALAGPICCQAERDMLLDHLVCKRTKIGYKQQLMAVYVSLFS